MTVLPGLPRVVVVEDSRASFFDRALTESALRGLPSRLTLGNAVNHQSPQLTKLR